MKKRIIPIICLFLFSVNTFGIISASAASRASSYFWCTDVRAYAVGEGKVLVEFDIDATHIMEEVGAKRVYIFEQQSDGDYSIVYTFYSDDYYSSMMDTNSAFGNGEVTYQGKPGVNYYAKCALYAKDSDGSETRYYNTQIVTAKA